MSGKVQSKFTNFDFLEINNSSAAVSASGKARLRWNDTTKQIEISIDGQAYVNIGDAIGSTEAIARNWVGV